MLVFSRDSQGNPTQDSYTVNYSMTIQYCASDQKNLMVVLVGYSLGGNCRIVSQSGTYLQPVHEKFLGEVGKE